jgi:hypothetical protein
MASPQHWSLPSELPLSVAGHGQPGGLQQDYGAFTHGNRLRARTALLGGLDCSLGTRASVWFLLLTELWDYSLSTPPGRQFLLEHSD